MSVASKVLIMDDEEVMREMLSMMLSASGYTVVLAEDGQEAISRFTEASASGEAFDAVISDLNIRCGMGGKEAITKLLEVDPCAKVILLSGYHCDPVPRLRFQRRAPQALPVGGTAIRVAARYPRPEDELNSYTSPC